MKLLLLFTHHSSKLQRLGFQKLHKHSLNKKGLLTVSQVTMYKVLQRILSRHEKDCLSKKFYYWKYNCKNYKEEQEKVQVSVQTEIVEVREKVEIAEIGTEMEVVGKEEMGVGTEEVEKVE